MFGKSKKEKKQVPVLVYQATEYAIKCGKEVGLTTLDFSVESLNTVDAILGGFSKNWTEEERKENIVREMMAWGAYLGEVIRKNVQSSTEWIVPESEADRYPYFSCKINNGKFVEISPMDKVYKRIVTGESESIPFYYKTLIQIINNGSM